MKTTELRVNNYVKLVFPDGEITCIVEGIKWDSLALNIDGRIGWYDLNSIKQIPLTGQWLLDLGFNQSIEGQWYIHFDEMCLTIYEDLPQYIVEIHDMEMDKSSIFLMSIKYVHQLQNLYFALMQEELILKLKNNDKKNSR